MNPNFARATVAAGLALLLWPASSRSSHEIPYEEPRVWGVLQIDRNHKKASIGDRVFYLSATTRCVIDEEDVSLRELAAYVKAHPGTVAEAELSGLAPNLILGLELEDPAELAAEKSSVLGDLTAVDSVSGTLTVVPDGVATPVTFQVDRDTDLQYDYTELTLAQLSAGFPAQGSIPIRVTTIAGSTVAEEVELELPVTVLHTVIRKYDAKAQTLKVTLRTGDQQPMTFQVLPGSLISRDLRKKVANRLRPGRRVTVIRFGSGGQSLLISTDL